MTPPAERPTENWNASRERFECAQPRRDPRRGNPGEQLGNFRRRSNISMGQPEAGETLHDESGVVSKGTSPLGPLSPLA